MKIHKKIIYLREINIMFIKDKIFDYYINKALKYSAEIGRASCRERV